jgi:hypothetical protein
MLQQGRMAARCRAKLKFSEKESTKAKTFVLSFSGSGLHN